MKWLNLLLLVCLLAVGRNGMATTPIHALSLPVAMRVVPANITLDDNAKIVVTRTHGALSLGGSVQTEGHLIKVMLVSRQGNPGSVIEDIEETYTVGRLPAGDYRLEMYLAVWTIQNTPPTGYFKLQEAQFSISPIMEVPVDSPAGLSILALTLAFAARRRLRMIPVSRK